MIRFYKGKQKLRRISSTSTLKTALYEILEAGQLGKIGIKHVIPVRLCRRKQIE